MNLNQITIPSKDLNISIPFYQKLGLVLIVESRPKYARFICPDGNSTFSIHYYENMGKDSKTSIYFECKNLDEKVDDLVRQGVVFEQMPIDQDWLWREARLKDPDGNQLVLYFAGENRLNPPWRIKNLEWD